MQFTVHTISDSGSNPRYMTEGETPEEVLVAFLAYQEPEEYEDLVALVIEPTHNNVEPLFMEAIAKAGGPVGDEVDEAEVQTWLQAQDPAFLAGLVETAQKTIENRRKVYRGAAFEALTLKAAAMRSEIPLQDVTITTTTKTAIKARGRTPEEAALNAYFNEHKYYVRRRADDKTTQVEFEVVDAHGQWHEITSDRLEGAESGDPAAPTVGGAYGLADCAKGVEAPDARLLRAVVQQKQVGQLQQELVAKAMP